MVIFYDLIFAEFGNRYDFLHPLYCQSHDKAIPEREFSAEKMGIYFKAYIMYNRNIGGKDRYHIAKADTYCLFLFYIQRQVYLLPQISVKFSYTFNLYILIIRYIFCIWINCQNNFYVIIFSKQLIYLAKHFSSITLNSGNSLRHKLSIYNN